MLEADEMKEFFEKCRRAGNGVFKRELSLFLEGIGLEFLRIIEDEIIRLKVMDTRLLLNSFHKGSSGTVWELSDNETGSRGRITGKAGLEFWIKCCPD